jgi:dUTP pyrophosphatase
MAIISGQELTILMREGLVSELIDQEAQIQMCGVELTLRKIERFTSQGAVAYDNKERKLAAAEEVTIGHDGWADLAPGPYLVTFNEIVSIPRDVAAIARPRSSLLETVPAWKPLSGTQATGKEPVASRGPQSLRHKAQENARLMQLVFLRLSQDARRSTQESTR